MAKADWVVLLCELLVLVGFGFKTFFKGVLALWVVHAAYLYLLRHGVHGDARKALDITHVEKKSSKQGLKQRHKPKRTPSTAHPAETPATLIPVSLLPPSHPFFRLRMVPHAVEANSRNRFLNFPGELRNKIYEYVLYIGKVQLVKIMQTVATPPTVLSLLQACRQVRDEAEGILFTVNQLSLAEDDFYEYFNQYSSKRLKTRYDYIKELDVLVDEAPVDIINTLYQISRLKNLRRLRIDVARISCRGKNLVTFDEDRARWCIRWLSNLKSFSIATTGLSRECCRARLGEIQVVIQRMIDEREGRLVI